MLQVRLLGQFDVRVDSKRVVISSRAGQSLLAYLLLTAGISHRRERLAGLFWPDTSDENARHSLRQELWRVRKVLSRFDPTTEYILAEELTVTFNPQADYWLDVAQLDRSVATDDPLADLSNQLALYRGELLPGFYDEWIVYEREHVQVLFEDKMKHLLELLCQEQRWANVLEWAERWITTGQTPEPAYRALMAAYAASGDRSKVTATFERCQAALDRELGVKPSDETRSLYAQLLQGAEVASVDLSTTHLTPLRLRIIDEPPSPGESPFKGLQYFDEADSELFFGRERLIAKIASRLRESRFLAVVVGASGSGKSSLVRAGLIPALKRAEPLADGMLPEGSRDWRFEIITPTAHPLEALATALTRGSPSVSATAILMDDLARDPRSLWLYVKRQMRAQQTPHLLMVVDQFEELFTLCRDEFEREAFTDNLLRAILPSPLNGSSNGVPREGGGGEGSLTLVLTIRADFYAHLAQYPELREAVATQQEYIGPMTADELRRAIEEPAKRGGWEFEAGLVDLMLRDVGNEPGALPLLSHALLETWKRRSGRRLTLKGYADAGGVRGAIAYTAETVYQQLPVEQRAIARNIFLRLTELGEGTEGTRRRAEIEELEIGGANPEQIRTVLTGLADARLITLSEHTVEVAHEALIREWPTLREWLTQDREGLRLHRHLTEAAREWEVLERDPGALYRGARLAQAGEWASANLTALNAHERAFLEASRAAEQQETMEREAHQQRELEAASRELATAATSNLEIDPERSILLALQAVSTTDTLEAEDALHRAVLASRVQLALRGHTDRVTAVAFSPDGARVATASRDGTARVWDAATGRELLILRGHQAPVNTVVISPDGKRLITCSDDPTTKVWDADSGAELLTLHHTTPVNTVTISADGRRLVTGGQYEPVKVWDAVTGKELLTLNTNDLDIVLGLAFSPDGRRVAASLLNSTVKVWDVSSGKVPFSLPTPSGLGQVAFSPDGARLAASDGPLLKVWDAATGKELLTQSGHTGPIFALAFSADGTRLATGGQDRKAIVWDAETGRKLITLSGNANTVTGVAFNPAGTQLVTSSDDGTARVWNVGLSRELLTLAAAHGSGRVAFSPDGTRLASGLQDGTAKVWDATTGQELLVLSGHAASVQDVAFSLDGTRLATASADRTAKVWDAATGQLLLTLAGHNGAINDIAFSPDGSRIATAGGDRKAIVWNASTGWRLLSLTGPAPIVALAFSSDGQRLATANGGGSVKVWDAATGRDLLALHGRHTSAVSDVVFSPDNQLLATASQDGTAIVWNAATGQELLTLSGHVSVVMAAAFSPDGKRLVTASRDGTAKVWDVATGQVLLTLLGDDAGLNGVALSPDGARLVTGSDSAMRVYLLPIEDLVALAHTRLMRTLTTDECQQFLHLDKSMDASISPSRVIPVESATTTGKVFQVGILGNFVDDNAGVIQSIYQGVKNVARQYGWQGLALASKVYADFETNFNTFRRSGCNLIVSAYFETSDATQAAAQTNPDQKFLALDFGFDPPLDNVWGQVYATDQAAFLAGYVAASVSKTGKVGTLGGAEFYSVTDFMDGFARGVGYYNDKHGKHVEVFGWDVQTCEGLFVGDFSNVSEGRRLAGQLLNEGVDVILPATGKAIGLTAGEVIRSHGNAYLIGTDVDWAANNPEFANIILTTVEKRYDVSVEAGAKAIVDGTFTGGTHVGTLESGEVGLSSFHELDSVVSAQVKSELEQIKAGIIAGKIKTKP